MELTDRELDTYSRQIVLEDIGYDGQLKLRQAKVCLVGVGGLGVPTALKLTGMGVGLLRIVDRDIVSRSDLHRQYLYDTRTIGRPKVEVALVKLGLLNPDVEVDAVPESLNSINAQALIQGMDVVIDGLDRPEPRYIVNRTCQRLDIPYIFGAALGSVGQAATLIPGQTFCLECFMPGLRDDDLPTCGTTGVHPAVLGIVSSVQVAEAVRVVTGKQPQLGNRLLHIDLSDMTFNMLPFSAVENCHVCGKSPSGKPETIADRYFEETCARDGRRNFVVTPTTRINLSIRRLAEVIKKRDFQTTSIGIFGVSFEAPSEITACILKSGIMIAQTPPRTDESIRTKVLDIYKSILIDGLAFPDSIVAMKINTQ